MNKTEAIGILIDNKLQLAYWAKVYCHLDDFDLTDVDKRNFESANCNGYDTANEEGIPKLNLHIIDECGIQDYFALQTLKTSYEDTYEKFLEIIKTN